MVPKAKQKKGRSPQYLRDWRKFRRMTLEQAAAAIEMHASTLSRHERGEIPYDQDLLDSLSMLYLCRPQDLISRTPQQSDLNILFRDASPSAKELIERLLRSR